MDAPQHRRGLRLRHPLDHRAARLTAARRGRISRRAAASRRHLRGTTTMTARPSSWRDLAPYLTAAQVADFEQREHDGHNPAALYVAAIEAAGGDPGATV